ncbi:hypothetical protein [Hyalangium gracile]|uniref:hypothetical protein n=1 Tax=Hyalangium gracile TaxID=394092 RepID=UPI001CC8FA27|nr:hypothetical protein [Hyalangium gracile]
MMVRTKVEASVLWDAIELACCRDFEEGPRNYDEPERILRVYLRLRWKEEREFLDLDDLAAHLSFIGVDIGRAFEKDAARAAGVFARFSGGGRLIIPGDLTAVVAAERGYDVDSFYPCLSSSVARWAVMRPDAQGRLMVEQCEMQLRTLSISRVPVRVISR